MTQTELYRDHLRTLDRYLADSLERAGKAGPSLEAVLFHSGRSQTYHADDREIPFQPCPHFRRWVPLQGPEHVVLARPGRKPRVVRVRPRDFWYDTSPPPVSYWEEAVELEEVETFEEVLKVLGPLERVAYVGPTPEAAQQAGIPEALIEPEGLMHPLDWYRATKTGHEISRIERAAEKAAVGHREAREAFLSGASEREIHWVYLHASDQVEYDSPYETIIALDEKGAILHYQNKRGSENAPGNVLLLDAGAGCEGYAADITRTWVRPDIDPLFRTMVEEMDRMERELVAMVRSGRAFLELHVEAHRRTGQLLAKVGLVKTSAEEAFERGITRTFLPHGLGHLLGLQVHDVGGHQAEVDGGRHAPPEEYPFLRNTRTLEPGHVVTIEPGIYFIPMLLEPLRHGEDSGLIDWPLVEKLTPYGGIRIEDNVLATEGEPKDLTRPLIEGPRGM